jgi:hypothetical protein
MLVDDSMGKTPRDKHPKDMKNAAGPEATKDPLQSGITLDEMREALRENGTVQDAAAALGISAPNFQQQWRRRCEHAGIEQTPAEWLDAEGLRELKGDTPRVFFRVEHAEHAALVAAAEDKGIGANALACQIVVEWLERRAKRAKRSS